MNTVKRPPGRVTIDLTRLPLKRFLQELKRIQSDEARQDPRLMQLVTDWRREFSFPRTSRSTG